MPQMWPKIALALGAIVHSDAVRVKKHATAAVSISGVPVYNYNRRFEQQKVASNTFQSKEELDWVVMFKADHAQGKAMSAFCGKSCTFKQKRFVTFRGDEALLQKHLTEVADFIEYIEPDMPVDVIPDMPAKSAKPASLGNYFHPKIGMGPNAPTGKDVNVYIMDTGVRTTHKEFEGRAIPTLDTFANQVCNGDIGCGRDTHGHGTHCAGSVGGKTWGVARQATLYGMKVCCGAGSNLYAGLDWIENNHVRPALISMSLGHPGKAYAARDIVDAVVAAGVSVFVAAGNSEMDTCDFTYGYIPSTIAVGATDNNDARTWWSNYGRCNDIYAPGLEIISASHLDDSRDKVMSGTSMACPLTAGAGAGLLGLNPNWSPAQLKAALVNKAALGVVSNLMPGDPNLRLRL